LFKRFDAALTKTGFLAMSGEIIDATIVAALKQRNTEAEKKAISPEGWKAKPAKLRQKDRDALNCQVHPRQAYQGWHKTR
jgi:transposase, IS5 family